MNISNHPILTTSKDVAEITKPLQRLGITFFDYARSDNNGGRICLTNHPSSTECYFTKEYYQSSNMDCHPTIYKPQIVFLETLPKQYIYDDTLRSYNIDHGMQVINPQENHCEFFTFATIKGNSRIINTYLTKLDFFKNFIEYFKECALSLINEVEKQKIILPFHHDQLDFLDNDYSELLPETILNHRTSITKRQLECAKLLLAGKNTREMANILNLSPRTIEHYLNHLKIKLKCKNKTEMIVKLAKVI